MCSWGSLILSMVYQPLEVPGKVSGVLQVVLSGGCQEVLPGAILLQVLHVPGGLKKQGTPHWKASK